MPVHTFQTLLDDLATIVKNTISTTIGSKSFVFEKINQATAIQQRAIDLLGISMIFNQ
ncbi:Mobile element protein [Richelia intracellularis]|nr:Mobile element protein [Richelia intracellularis]